MKLRSLFLGLIAVLPIAGMADGAPELTPADFDYSGDFFLVELFKIIFTPRYFEPHMEHFIYDPGLMWSIIVANALVAIAYTLIPIALVYFIIKRKDVFEPQVFVLFGAFIILCGLHHVVHILTFWYPIYHFQNIVDVLTGIVSIATFFALVRILPAALKIKTPQELKELNKELEGALKELHATNAELETARTSLEKEVEARTKELERANTSLEEQVAARTGELQEKIADLEKINAVMVGREQKMADLKREIETLKSQQS